MFDEEFVKGTLTPILAIVGAASGLIGSILGFYNLFLSRKQHVLRVRVTVRGGGANQILVVDGVNQAFAESRELNIHVANNSYFAVTIEEAGLILKRHFWNRPIYFRLHGDPGKRIESRHHGEFTTVLDSRRCKERAPLYQLIMRQEATFRDATRAYARLSTGHLFKSKKKELQELKQELTHIAVRFTASAT